MSENSIMTLSDFRINKMTAEAASAIEIHNNIVTSMRAAASAMVTLCENLKAMRDTQNYKALGFEKFEDYTEQACNIKKRQAYNYIQTYERLGRTFLQSNANLGITKLQLLTEVTAPDRPEFVEQNNLAEMSVTEIKQLIAQRDEYAEQLSIFKDNEKEHTAEIERLRAENEELSERPSVVNVQQPSQEQIDAAVAQKEKELEASYKDKLKKAKAKEQEKAEKEKRKAVDEARTAAEKEAAAKFKAQIEKANKDKAEAEERASKFAAKLDKNADADLVKASLYFGEAQKQLESFNTAANKITSSDPDKGARLKKVAADFLKKYIDNLSTI